MAINRQRRPILTNAEGLEIPQPRGAFEGFKDRVTFILIGLMQLVAVAIIIRQMKALKLLPDWIDTDVKTVHFNKIFHALMIRIVHSQGMSSCLLERVFMMESES
jgi:hypothetical protein